MALILILLVIFARVWHLRMPLDRDEGEYAYTGQLMLQGIPPFILASNMKLPGTAAAYALIMALFGQTASGIHLGFLIVNVATIVVIFFLDRRLFGEVSGWAASASYALLSAGVGVLGTSANAEHFVVLPALLASLLLLRWADSQRYGTLFWSGLLYGLAVLMKQPGVFLAVFGTLYLLSSQRQDWRTRPGKALGELGLFALAGLLPLAVMCLALWQAGLFPKFWFWTVTYARAYGSVTPPSKGFSAFLQGLQIATRTSVIPWLLGLVGLVLVWTDKRRRAPALWATAFLGFSFLAVCPGLYFREHYFVFILPATAVLAGAAVVISGEYVSSDKSVLLFALLITFSAAPQFFAYFGLSDTKLSRDIFGGNPFPEAVDVANYISNHAGKDDRIAVLGSEPEIYFYARRLSVTDHIYTYPLVEPQPFALQMQNEMIRDIEVARPAYIVMVNVPVSWQFLSNAKRIFDWFSVYARKNYDLVGIADMVSASKTVYIWDGAAAAYQPLSPFVLDIFKRKDTLP